MRHLIIYAHPNSESLNHHFKEIVIENLTKSGHEIIVRDLYELEFNPVLSMSDMIDQMKGTLEEKILAEQEYISWAENIIFIYPIWWTGMPAIMKGYIDRIFTYGFAYRYDQGIQKGLLTGKSAIIINTHGKSNAEYATIGMDKALSLTSDRGIYQYCGLEIKEHLFFGKADRVTKETVEDWDSKILEISNR